mgnify:CR=1 FL=1
MKEAPPKREARTNWIELGGCCGKCGRERSGIFISSGRGQRYKVFCFRDKINNTAGISLVVCERKRL